MPKTQSLAETAALKLEELITLGEYTGGDRLPEVKLAKDLDVSRSTIREALLLLERRHLIDIHANCGAVVTKITPADVFFLGKMAKLLLACVIEDVVRSHWTQEQEQNFERLVTAISEFAEDKDTLNAYLHIFEFINAGLAFSKQQGNRYLLQMLDNILPCLRRDLYRSFQLNPYQTLDKAVECIDLMHKHAKQKNTQESQRQLYELIDVLMEILTTALIEEPHKKVSFIHQEPTTTLDQTQLG